MSTTYQTVLNPFPGGWCDNMFLHVDWASRWRKRRAWWRRLVSASVWRLMCLTPALAASCTRLVPRPTSRCQPHRRTFSRSRRPIQMPSSLRSPTPLLTRYDSLLWGVVIRALLHCYASSAHLWAAVCVMLVFVWPCVHSAYVISQAEAFSYRLSIGSLFSLLFCHLTAFIQGDTDEPVPEKRHLFSQSLSLWLLCRHKDELIQSN